METVDVVIKISKEQYDYIRNGQNTFTTELCMRNAIYNGVVLPKEHDDLIERSQVTNYDNLSDVPVVIKTDKGVNK